MRKEAFKALVGSHNYNLNTQTSDKDYKVFVLPTFDDLFSGRQFSKATTGEIDIEYHDIRKLSNLLWKSNINFLEVLFSEELEINTSLTKDSKDKIEEIINLKDQIARMNLPYLYNACVGMYISKRKQVDKGTKNTQELIAKYGYDTKQAMATIRVLDFLKRFAEIDFSDFKKAIWYEKPEGMLLIKDGYLSKEAYQKLADKAFNEIESKYKDLYKQEPNIELNQHLINNIKIIIKNEI